MTALFKNNAYSTLASGIIAADTTIALTATEGARFPSPTGADYFYMTLIDTSNNLEIVKVTTRSTDTLTVVRAQEGTTALAYSAGDRVELRVTAAGLTETVTASAASAASAAADAVSTAADAASTAADAASTAADAASTAADAASTAADAASASTSAATASSAAAGIRWKDRTLCATTANITLSAEQTIDGILTSASRVLVKDQTAPAENGVYVSAAGAWARTTDADTWDELVSLAVAVEQGTTLADSIWICTSDSGGTLGTTAITFARFGNGGLGDLISTNNLSDVTSAATSRTNLGLVIGTDVLAPTGDGSGLTGIATGATAAEKSNIMLNAFRIAVNGALSIQNMVDGKADVYTDETGVDTAGSTNQTFGAPITATRVATLENTGIGSGTTTTFTGAALGTSTSDRVIVVAASVNGWAAGSTLGGVTIAGNAATQIVDQPSVGGNTEQSVAIWTYALGTGVTSGDIVLTAGTGGFNNIYIFVYDMKVGAATASATATVSATDNATANAVTGTLTIPANGFCLGLHRAGNTTTTAWGTGGGMAEVYDAATTSSSYHNSLAESFPSTAQTSITVSATPSASAGPNIMCAAAWGSSDSGFYTPAAASNMTLLSNAMTALSTPTTAYIVIEEEDVDAITLNTDLKAYASRDGGTTYTQITLAVATALTTGQILTGSIDISAQPAGTSMKYKIETLNTKSLKIHSIGLTWS